MTNMVTTSTTRIRRSDVRGSRPFSVDMDTALPSRPASPAVRPPTIATEPARVPPVGLNAGQPAYAWTDLTYLLYKSHVSWGYYVVTGTEPDCENPAAETCAPVNQSANTPGIWNPLPWFDTVKADGQLGNIQSVDHFYTEAKTGTLPAVSWVVPSGTVSEHPPAPVSYGQSYVTSLVNAVMKSPETGPRPPFFLAWDDWGGFYDHVVPPSVDQNGYGLRSPVALDRPVTGPAGAATVGAVQVLLTSTAHHRFWSGIARDGIDALVMDNEGRLSLSGLVIEREQAEPEIAWATSDLFGEGAPRRQFLGLVRRAGSLRWFQSPAAGFDDPVFTELADRGVRVSNAHVNGIPIAEFVMRAVLDHFQAAERWRRAQADREWSLHDFREVNGSNWLVIGLGSIGGGVARRARAFGATVIGCRRQPGAGDPTDRTVTPDELGSVIGQADVVVLCAPATPATRGLVDSRFLAAMKEHSVLVNVSRGTLVDEDALLAALNAGRPEAAILDVFASEPLEAEHPFWSHPAVTVTPHNAAGGVGRYGRQAELFSENLGRYLTQQPLLNDVTDLARAGGSPPERGQR